MASTASRLILWLGLGLVLMLIVMSVGIFFIGSAVTSTVNKLGPRLTGTAVTLEGAKISPLTGSGELTGLFVGNPDGWTGDKLAYLGRIKLDVAPTSLLGDTIHVRELTIEQPEFVYERGLMRSNLKDLTEHIEKAVGSGTTDPAAEETAAGGDAKKIAVDRFVLKTAKVTVIAAGNTLEITLPDIELNNLGTPDNGLTAGQLSLAVSKQLLSDIAAATAGAVASGKINLNDAGESVKQMGDALKGLFGGKKKEPEPGN